MGVERGTTANQAATVAAQRPAAGKAAAQAAAGGDFLALMAALEDAVGLGEGDVPGTAKPAGKRGRGDADAAAIDPAAVGAGMPLPMPPDGAVPPAPLPGGTAAPAGRGIGIDAVDAGPAPLVATGAAQAGAVAGAGAPASDGPAASATAPKAATADGPAAVSLAPERAAAGTPAADPRLAPQYASVFEQLQQHLAARAAGAPDVAARPAPASAVTAATQTRDPRDTSRAERGAAALSASAARAEGLAVVLAQDPAAAGGAKARSGGQDAAGGGAGEHRGADAGGAGWAAPDFTPTVQYDAALASLDGAAQADGALDRQLADQLRHWASQGVRSAELTVGTSDPVQVRIALDGNEAQVQFRAEHAATRELLAGSVDQLRQLLGAEGLVLSGVSVGGHDTGGSQGRAGDGPAGHAAMGRSAVAGGDGAGGVVGDAAVAVPRQGAGVLDLYV